MVRALRRARQALGPWRDCDVLMELLERKTRRIRNPEEKNVWEMVRNFALTKRKDEIRRSRRKVIKSEFFTLLHSVQISQLSWPCDGRESDPRSVLFLSVRKGYAQWCEGLARASESLSAIDIHAFRIQTKRLRYRIELAADLGDGEAPVALTSLKMLQDELGSWHDQAELTRLAAKALSNPDFLMEHPRSVAGILRKMDRDHALQIERIHSLFATTHQTAAQVAASSHNPILR